MTRQMIPAWARDFDNSKRHCWPGKDEAGQPVRWMEGYHETCTEDHNPKLIGEVEWLRFIRNFGQFSTDNPFAPKEPPDGIVVVPALPIYHLFINPYGHPTSTGQIHYSESYFREHESDWGLDIVFRVFLDNANGWARIECYDNELVGSCELTRAFVEESYGGSKVSA